jgi:hypothetical protein
MIKNDKSVSPHKTACRVTLGALPLQVRWGSSPVLLTKEQWEATVHEMRIVEERCKERLTVSPI